MDLQDLIATLIEEHRQMNDLVRELRAALSDQERSLAPELISRLVMIFKQHIADEESQILKILIESYGVRGAQDAIDVFRAHRPIYSIMQRLENLADLSHDELNSRQDELRELLSSHTSAEEGSVFPQTLAAPKRGR